MNCQLTVDDCVEIYYALEYSMNCDELCAKIGSDGELLAAGTVTLTASELEDCRNAVESKLAAIRAGNYGRDRETREWGNHLEAILDILAEVKA